TAEPLDYGVHRDIVRHLQRTADIEPHDDLVGVDSTGAILVRRIGGAANQLTRDGVTADQLAFIFELDLPGDCGQRGVNVRDAWHDIALAGLDRATLGVGNDVLHHADRHALGDAGTLVDPLVIPCLESDALDHLGDEIGN